MAPTQHHNGSSCLSNSNTADSLHTASSSNSKITSSRVSNSSSNSNLSYNSNNSRGTSVDGRTSEMEWPRMQESLLLPIATRGLFHNDSFFEDSRRNFDEAVKEVLEQSGQRSDQTDDLASYRKLREYDPQDKNQAVSVSEDDVNHKVVLDIREFMKGDVRVKVIDEDELVVEGSFEKEDGGSVSKKSFRRSFIFPGLVKADAVSSAMSSDGVLTVTVPKNNQRRVSSKLANTQSTDSMSSKSTEKGSVHGDSLASRTFFNDIESDFLLPITKKGLFFQDSFFEPARQDFEKSVQDVLDKSGERDTLNEDNMTTYRSLRERNLQQENQAVSVTEEEDHHKVVLDVKDFASGDVKVKIVNEDEVTVEGKVEQQNGGATSTKSFYRSFTFPGLIKPDAITSAMSSDGILTVKVPKDKQRSSLESSNSSNSIHSTTKQNQSSKNSSIKTDFRKSDSNANIVNESLNSNESLLPVFEKGLFFHDDFFASARQDFEKAVNEVVGKHGEDSSFTDNMTSYRTLRERDIKDENQAVTTSEDHQCHKVVIDVRDFMHNDLKVKMVDENELVVEGKVEKKEGGSVSTKDFRRSFVFPGLVNSDAVSSSMSSDGVLIITVPKIQQQNRTQTIHPVANNDTNSTSTSENASRLNSAHKVFNHSLHQGLSSNSTFQDEFDQLCAQNSLNMMDTDRHLPLSHMTSDFHDNFFARAHQEFENASKRVFSHCDQLASTADDSRFFGDFHNGVSKEEDDSVSMTEDELSHKVKIDVSDFVGGDLQVKALEQNELLVEGRMEKDESGKTSSKSFSRRVQLPGTIKVDEITSVLSKDGILLITAPKDSSKSSRILWG